MSKRAHGDGGIDKRPDGTPYRIRYRVNGERFSKAFSGTIAEAKRELRALIRSGDTGEHIAPDRLTLGAWIDQWIEAGAPGRKKKRVGQRTLERYEQLLRVHVKPALGHRPLQQMKAIEIDKLYADIEAKAGLAPLTRHHIHTVFSACLATAERKGLVAASPMKRVEQVPSANEVDHGEALEEEDLRKLVAGFRQHADFPIVALAAATGARRNELFALRWSDLNSPAKTLRIERALERTKKFGLRFKPPKTKRGLRTIALDDGTIDLLLQARAKLQRLKTGIPDGADVDLSLVRLPDDALMFPAVPERGCNFDFGAPRNPEYFTKSFAYWAGKLGFEGFHFHHFRGTHATLLLDKLVPVHVVAERIGDDPAVLLRNYAKRKRKATANMSVSGVIDALASGFLKL